MGRPGQAGCPDPFRSNSGSRSRADFDTSQAYTYIVCMQDRVDRPKSRMVRKQVFVTADQNRRLKSAAAKSGRAEAELVREGLELALGGAVTLEDNWRERMKEVIASSDFDETFAEGIERNKKAQAALWRKRLARTRKALRDM